MSRGPNCVNTQIPYFYDNVYTQCWFMCHFIIQLQINEAYATAPKNTNEPTRPAHDYNTLEPPTNHYDLGPEDNGSYSSPYI